MENKDITEEEFKLPFEKKMHTDWPSWIYEHRAGILVTLIIYLIFGIALVTAKIVISQNETVQWILIDLSAVEDMEFMEVEEQQPDDAFERMLNREDFRDVRNLTSNENAQLDAGLRDARGSQASEIYNEAQALEDKLNSSRAAYEQGLQDADNILNQSPDNISGNTETVERARVEGSVTVSYDLPGRNDTSLPVPAYQCEGGGMVVINITVNRNGVVTASSVDRISSSDPCLVEMASKAAARSRFNVTADAPERQNGTITYTFIPQ
ncbi:MAG: energy transducer TonB [Rikenellaceae bacterium]|nr:energy transducer TonB [Rikenellaceae bacterium]